MKVLKNTHARTFPCSQYSAFVYRQTRLSIDKQSFLFLFLFRVFFLKNYKFIYLFQLKKTTKTHQSTAHKISRSIRPTAPAWVLVLATRNRMLQSLQRQRALQVLVRGRSLKHRCCATSLPCRKVGRTMSEDRQCAVYTLKMWCSLSRPSVSILQGSLPNHNQDVDPRTPRRRRRRRRRS